MEASTGIRTGPAGVTIGSTLRGGGEDWGVVTLRGGTGIEAGLRTRGLGTGIKPVINSERIVKVDTWLLVRGLTGEPGVGFRVTSRMSWTPVKIKSLDDAIGIVTLVGNHDESVLQVRRDRVLQIQTL